MNARVDTRQLEWKARRPESWKYTDVKRLSQQLAADLECSPAAQDSLLAAPPFSLNGLSAIWLDGVLIEHSPELKITTLPALENSDFGVLPSELSPAAHQAYQLVLNAEHQEQQIHLQFVYSDQRDALSRAQINIQVDAGVSVQLVEEHRGGRQGLSLSQLTLDLAENSKLQHVRLQHAASTHFLIAEQTAVLASNAELQQVHIDWGARLSRLASRLDLAASHAKLSYHALSGLTGRQHCDHQVEVRHLSPDCTSQLRARGILDDSSRQVFNGKVYVARGAQKTDSDQLLRNLLLSDKAEVDAKPELEIYADDVKCAHGSTVGRLDDAALFYMRSRGVDKLTARRLLMLSFAEHILGEIPHEELANYARQSFADHLSLQTSS
ncbi:MAG: Fe-S cluster assembly protein SufD [Oceanococcus sp.]